MPFARGPQIERTGSRGLGVTTTFDLAVLLAHPGLVAFTAIALGLIAYLAYSMMHPEAF